MKTVVIDGINYVAETELQKETRLLLCDIYGTLWTEAYYDPDSEETRKFAKPIADKMTELNKILGFKK